MQDALLPEALMQCLLLPLIEEMLPVVGNDKDAAWESAEAATMSLHPDNVIEFRLALRVALFNIQANKLTADANAPTLTPACAVRVRQCALTYAREADKAERRLEKLQAARLKEEKPLSESKSLPSESPKAEPAPAKAEETPTQPPPAEAPVPAYKLLKQQRRLAKQQEREARLKVSMGTQDQTNPHPSRICLDQGLSEIADALRPGSE